MTRPVDALVVGGGLSGAALAYHLARAGRDVTLIEREMGPHHKVCGEFMSFEVLHYLRRIGLDPGALGGKPITAVRLAGGGEPVSCKLPFPAFSLSRFRLDEALLARADVAGASLLRGISVRALEYDNGIWRARLANGDAIEGRDAFLATGKHDLKARRRPPGLQNDLIGLKLHLRLDAQHRAELAGHVELVLFEGGYGGLELIEDEQANLCLLVQKARFAKAGNRWDRLLAEILIECPHLGRRLRHAAGLEDRPLAIAAIPYGFVRRQAADCWHLGDQAAVIPSFAGEGMAIALHSAQLAASAYIAGASASAFQTQLAEDVAAQVRRATWLSRLLVQGWAQGLGLAGARLIPGLLGGIALSTRIDAAALQGAHP